MVALAQSHGLLVIADVKRGDIGSTAEAYAKAHLDVAGADAVTVNPYFGTDGLEPFFKRCREAGQGRLRPGEDLQPEFGGDPGPAAGVGRARSTTGWPTWCEMWGREADGQPRATAPSAPWWAARTPSREPRLRKRLAGVPFLIPGYGAQGATRPTWPRCSTRTAPGRWSTRPGPSSTPTRRRRAGTGWTPPANEAAAMRAALWQAAGRA